MANRKTGADRRPLDQLKQMMVDELRQGSTVLEALDVVGRGRQWYHQQRTKDPDFAMLCDKVRTHAASPENRAKSVPDFPEFCEQYLGMRLWPHQLAMFDVLEGREPRWNPDGLVYEPGSMGHRRVLINVPPGHGKALALDTEVLTPFGWSTIGRLQVGDQVFGPDGKPTNVIAKSEVFHKPTTVVEVNCGESFTASDDHLWQVGRRTASGNVTWRVCTTSELEVGDLFPPADALVMDEQDFILDPYLLGCWLGDGHTSGGQFTSADEEVVQAFAEAGFAPNPLRGAGRHRTGRATTYGTTGLFPILAELGLIGGKRIPEGYLLGSYEQRLGLLQGLMDTDGTVSGNGQSAFTSTNRDLAWGVAYLAASLGIRGRIKESRAMLGDRDCGPKWTFLFTERHIPVFRLPRKLDRQVNSAPVRSGGQAFRRVTALTSCEQVPTQCITVDNDSHLFLAGRSLVPTHNTMTVSISYILWRLLKDTSMTVLLISKTQGFAAKVLWAIKQRLTHPKYADLQLAFGPSEGFKETAEKWTSTQIYLWGTERDSQDKDPSIEAVGIGGQIYGNRAKLVLIDDAIVLSNASGWENQQDWIRQEVASRIGPDDQIAVVGTRVAPVDLYRQLRDPDHYADGEVPWTYLGMPAVLEYGDTPDDWVTLWPTSDIPFAEADVPDEEGLFPRWSGARLSRIRNEVGAKRWALVYMQQSVNDEAVFDPVCVKGSQDGRRSAGQLPVPGVAGGCNEGARLTTIIGVDPAVVGNTAMCVYTLDPRTGQRWVVDMKVLKGPTPTQIREMLEMLVDQFKATEVIVEANAFQAYLVKDPTVTKALASRGVMMKGHYTHSGNKLNPEYGVASMAPLLGTTALVEHQKQHQKDNLVSLPAATTPGMKMFIEELVSWDPAIATRKRQQDCVMAWWVAETRARELMIPEGGRRGFQRKSEFLSANDANSRYTVRLSDAAQYGRVGDRLYM